MQALRIKEDIDLRELEKYGFKKHWFGIYGSGDYIPEYWYEKRYYYKNKEFYVMTNRRYFDDKDTTLTELKLYQDCATRYDKKISFNRFYKVVRIIIKDLMNIGIVERC